MTSPVITTQRQRELIEKMTRLVDRRARDEVEIRQRHAARVAEAKQEHDEQRRERTAEFEAQHGRLIGAYQEAREAAFSQYESEGHALAQEEDALSEAASLDLGESLDDAKTIYDHRCLKMQNAFREQEVVPKQELGQFKQQCDFRVTEALNLLKEGQDIVRRRCEWPEELAEPPIITPGLSAQESFERAAAEIARGRQRLRELQHPLAARFLEEGWLVLIFIFAAVAAGVASWTWLGHYGLGFVAAVSFFVPLVITIGLWLTLRPLARSQTLRIVPAFQQAIIQSQADVAASLQAAHVAAQRKHAQIVERRDRDLVAARAEYERNCQQLSEEHDARLRPAAAGFQSRRNAIEEIHEDRIEQIEEKYPQQISELEKKFEAQILELSEVYRSRRAAIDHQFEQQWQELVAAWSSGLAEFQTNLAEMNRYCHAQFPAWDKVEGDASVGNVSALCFGRYEFDLERVEGGLPKTDGLETPQSSFSLPAVLSYPQCPSLLLEAEGEGRDAATRLLQDVMLRLLTTFPPGKVRFTIIDPVGLGQNFSAFMHLADYDERLVSSRIWTESSHVNQRLADLTEHMENVIQKYLRNEFASIQEYNEHAGEVAEPFQILVVANFPANFSEESARRLVSIASSGARCGVYTLISTDNKLKLPRNFDMADLESQAATLLWNADERRFQWKQDDLRCLPLAVESPPDDERFTSIVRSVGRLAKDSSRVEVPFESVVPPAPQWWTADSRGEIEVPLGRAGAKKLQYMRLGHGTSQHVLISGKTGSGKSTLLNALITNLAIHYSPDELQFYLIDFKKGVEFKAYATNRLPHARVIAIESEREFGMSVLERLDVELKRRGDLFRKHGVQDLKGYRNAHPAAVMPRILLVIDEFQEFFTSDDKISHDAALYLDRLVRQGRAFGIHVMLGSQTLAGAYSLARSTLGQMAVRIALQCSESDAHLILSEDNTAARLLNRPGEAIYNDANGLFEGNHPFQVVWLPDHQREAYLRQVADLADERRLELPTPTIFEGNVAADPQENDLLRQSLENPSPVANELAPRAWLGSAVAIKDPTAVALRRQGGNNLLIVGQQEELALGILTHCVISLASQLRPATQITLEANGPTHLHRFYVLDGTRPESPQAGFWQRFGSQLSVDASVARPRDAADVVRTLAAEVDRRLTSGEQGEEPIFLIVDNLARFRDLKKSDDFGSLSYDDDEAAAVDKQFTTILREGPAHGVHTLVWCDSYNNLNRWLDRPMMRDFELRVLFQMSANDSSNLMDSPMASRLGPHLAIFYSEEQGLAEKFRPYGPPGSEWLAWVEQQLAHRASAQERPVGQAP